GARLFGQPAGYGSRRDQRIGGNRPAGRAARRQHHGRGALRPHGRRAHPRARHGGAGRSAAHFGSIFRGRSACPPHGTIEEDRLMSASARLPNILVIGTGDTKSDELLFMADIIARAGGLPVMLDVSVLGDPPYMPDYSKHDIARAAKTTSPCI